jgi:hypothetical protein
VAFLRMSYLLCCNSYVESTYDYLKQLALSSKDNKVDTFMVLHKYSCNE